MAFQKSDRPLQQEVLSYFERQPQPVRFSLLARDIRNAHQDLTDSALLDAVQPLILTGQLEYTPELKITAPEKHSR